MKAVMYVWAEYWCSNVLLMGGGCVWLSLLAVGVGYQGLAEFTLVACSVLITDYFTLQRRRLLGWSGVHLARLRDLCKNFCQ
jgi:hypothetical protein